MNKLGKIIKLLVLVVFLLLITVKGVITISNFAEGLGDTYKRMG